MIKRPINQTTTAKPERTLNWLSVNLLPTEIMLQRQQSFRLTLSTKLSIAALVLLIFFTSLTLTLRIFQNSQIEKAKKNEVVAQGKIDSLRSKEDQLILLKTRLSSIKSLMGVDNRRKAIFNLVVFLTPSDTQISDVTVDKDGKMVMSLTSPTLASIDSLISSLGNQEKNSDLISKVDMEGLSLGKDLVYRFALEIIPKTSN